MASNSKLGCNSVYDYAVRSPLHILSFSCSSVFRTCLKEYDPQTAKRRKEQCFSNIHTRELNKHYVNYFNLTKEAKRCLARSLGISVESLRKWMRKKWQDERDLERTKNRIQTSYKQEHGLNVAGMRVTLTGGSGLSVTKLWR